MDCAGIHELLSEYIDGNLDATNTKTVEEHIATCEDCKETFISLSAMVEELNAIEPVKAPTDFLEKIHQRMESRSTFSRFFRKLFVPLKIKIPLQLAAAATASILVVMVLSIQKSEYVSMQPLKASRSERFMENSKSDNLTSQFKTKSPYRIHEETPGKIPNSEQDVSVQSSKAKTLAQPSGKRKSEPPAPTLAKVRPLSGNGRPLELVLVLNTVVPGAASKPDLGMEAATMQKSNEKSVEIERTDKDLPGRHLESRQKNQVESLLTGMDRILSSIKGRILTKEYHKQSNLLKSILVQIPSKNYISFCRKISILATFKTPPPPHSGKNRETVDLLITFAYPD
jgi:hypothetical protein